MEQVRLPSADGPPVATDTFKAGFGKIAAFLGRPAAETVLFAGVPFDEKGVSLEDVARLSERIGLEFREHSRGDLLAGNADLPVLILQDDGAVLALLETDGKGRFSTQFGRQPGAWLTQSEVLDRPISHILSFSVVYANTQEEPGVGSAARIERRASHAGGYNLCLR